MDRNPYAEYKPGIGLGDPVTITLAAAEWLQVYEFLYWAEIPEHSGMANEGTIHLQNSITEALVTEAHLRAKEAAREAARTKAANEGPAGFLRGLASVLPGVQLPPMVPDPDDFDKEAICPNCKHTAPLLQWKPRGDTSMACPVCDYEVDTR